MSAVYNAGIFYVCCCLGSSDTDMYIADREIQVGGAREGQSFVLKV
jgi:hypothetical protein